MTLKVINIYSLIFLKLITVSLHQLYGKLESYLTNVWGCENDGSLISYSFFWDKDVRIYSARKRTESDKNVKNWDIQRHGKWR